MTNNLLVLRVTVDEALAVHNVMDDAYDSKPLLYWTLLDAWSDLYCSSCDHHVDDCLCSWGDDE